MLNNIISIKWAKKQNVRNSTGQMIQLLQQINDERKKTEP